MNASQQAEAAKLTDRAYGRKEVVEIIRSVLDSIDKSVEPSSRPYNDFTALATYIENMRADLVQLRSIEISHNHIPTATDELDAVVEETAKATGTIMDCCESIEKTAEKLDPSAKTALSSAVTAIYEACSFQDITGQRITKVIKTLKRIEEEILEIISIINQQDPTVATSAKDKKILLDGPQLRSKASSQEKIDKLLDSFS